MRLSISFVTLCFVFNVRDMLVASISFDTPFTDPVLKFLVILLIMLLAPALLNRIKVPPLLGLIIAGAIVGPHGFNIVERDSSIILSGTAGLLYIMFLAGLEIDLADFRKNSWRSLIFGFYTFMIPMILGTGAGYFLLEYSLLSSVLLASMLASHTLIAYVIVSRLGLAKDQSVVVTVGGTMITDTLALLVLTVVVGMDAGEVNDAFWIRLGVSMSVFTLLVLVLFPVLCRWFFKKFSDPVLQYVFVLVMLFSGAFLAMLAGMESILGAFLVGLALNRLIPRTSALMNRIEFVGNSIFIPFFLIGVGMLIDYRAFFTSFETIYVGFVMVVVATFSKYAAAWLTQKTFRYSDDQRGLIFGLSNAQAAATLAAVMVGYNVGLLNEAVLNGTVLMILVTCATASIVAQKSAHNMVSSGAAVQGDESHGPAVKVKRQRILVPVGSSAGLEDQVNMAVMLRGKAGRKEDLYLLRVVDDAGSDSGAVKRNKDLLLKAVGCAAASDIPVSEMLRYDVNIYNAVSSVVSEEDITDVVYGLSSGRPVPDAMLPNDMLSNSSLDIHIYRSFQPLATLRRHVVVLPELSELEIGFRDFMSKVASFIRNTGSKAIVRACPATMEAVRKMYSVSNPGFIYLEFESWRVFVESELELKDDDMLWMLLSRKGGISYQNAMKSMPVVLNRVAASSNTLVVFPRQVCTDSSTRFLT